MARGFPGLKLTSLVFARGQAVAAVPFASFLYNGAQMPGKSLPTARKYYFVNQLKTWSDAQSYCRLTYNDLATLENADDMSKLNAATKNWQIDVVWIGLYNDINSWKWSISDQAFYIAGGAGYRNWGLGQPDNAMGNQSCVSMMSTGTFFDNTCDTDGSFLYILNLFIGAVVA
uniref:C-type lectin domain-containing protein n=1 Tax=Denticeps clupeoides TaxID=299321 RepID=A0AAY4DG18_9TELE